MSYRPVGRMIRYLTRKGRADLKKEQTFENIEERDSEQQGSMDKRLDELHGEGGASAAAEAPKKKGKKNGSSGRKRAGTILSVALGIVLALLIVGAGYLVWILNRPQDLFVEATSTATEEPAKETMEPAFDLSGFATVAPEPTESALTTENEPDMTEEPIQTPLATAVSTVAPSATPTAVPTTEPTAEPTAEPVKDNIVNIMLLGIDAFENGTTTSGTEPHTDVMMVVAVNFDKDTVDLITLPRDIFTTAPGLHGFYKLNGVFNAGGGMKDMESGFALTCRAAEIWLGGISIPYYYAVDFKAVVDVVNAIGGIDYDVDQPFTAYRLAGNAMTSGKHYDKGMHHLDGNAVLQYLRIRHEAGGLDSDRTARQRRMMVAIFNKLKTEGKLSQIPALINAASSGIYTNTTLSQTAALANYAMTKIDVDQIRTRSIYGDLWYQHYFKYIFVDQQNRIDIIKEVYGIDAEPIGLNTPEYENWLYDIGFLAIKYVRQPEKAFEEIQKQKDQGKTFTDAQIAAYAACYQAYTDLDQAFRVDSERLQQAYVDSSLTAEQIKAMEKEIKAELKTLNAAVKNTTLALRNSFGLHVKLEWEVGTRWFVDQDINEVIVAFG